MRTIFTEWPALEENSRSRVQTFRKIVEGAEAHCWEPRKIVRSRLREMPYKFNKLNQFF